LFVVFVSGTESLCWFIEYLAIITTYFIYFYTIVQESKCKAVLI
jgi:hypothetical protein